MTSNHSSYGFLLSLHQSRTCEMDPSELHGFVDSKKKTAFARSLDLVNPDASPSSSFLLLIHSLHNRADFSLRLNTSVCRD